MQIAQELQLEVKRSTRKHELKMPIVEQLVDEDVLPESCLEVYKPLLMEPSGQVEIRRLEIKRELRPQQLETQAQQKKKSLKLNSKNKSLKLKLNKENKI